MVLSQIQPRNSRADPSHHGLVMFTRPRTPRVIRVRVIVRQPMRVRPLRPQPKVEPWASGPHATVRQATARVSHSSREAVRSRQRGGVTVEPPGFSGLLHIPVRDRWPSISCKRRLLVRSARMPAGNGRVPASTRRCWDPGSVQVRGG